MEEEKKKIEKIFELLTQWYQLPKYQLERRLDIFFALYLPEILETKGISKVNNINIFPEFPLKKDGQDEFRSNNADYAIIYKEKDKYKLCLIELKTDPNSINRKNQFTYYENILKKSFEEVLEGIIQIEQRTKETKSKDANDKYNKLLKRMSDLKIIKEKENGWETNTEIINQQIQLKYIVPEKKAILMDYFDNKINQKEKKGEIIEFDEIIKIISKNQDEISRNFCSILNEIKVGK